ncbi:ComEC/Rec2 family competence protein [Nonlabens ulvanivorans]|uniref:ComEC/Rec2 family competence protein n=1 Tax=Nonlabens ulvanivorans TaxID=906888 RepID=UPI0029429851|nr:ComEC/Rec2 family competence protein [Nonlabens ulvanivorans]WOI22782.1 ComEC/Rec2 family competence protein [Nonlabens ulvanivorans]
MKWLGYPIYRLLLAYVIGLLIAMYLQITIDIALIVLSTSFLILCFSIFFSRTNTVFKALFSFSVIFFLIALGVLNMVSKRPINQSHHFSNHTIHGKEQMITFQLTDQLNPNAYNDRFYAHINEIDGKNVTGKVLVLFKKSDSVEYKIGHRLTVYDDISQASDERNPGDFNYKEYLALIDVHGQIYVDDDHILNVYVGENKSWIIALRNQLMNSLETSGLQDKPLGIIQALILGQRNNVESSVTQSFRDAGVIHILALSGLHVGIILLILCWFTNWLKVVKNGRWLQSAVIIILLWIFALITGMSPSIMRAVTMFSFIAIGMNVNRKTSIFHSLALSAFLLLLINPKLLFHVGFQLSYTAVIAIVLIQPILYNLIQPRWKVIDYFWKIGTVTIAAQIGVAPLSLFYFHQFPGLFLLGNMLLLPVLPLIIGLSILLLASLWSGIPSYWLVEILNLSLDWIVTIIEKISSQDQFIIKGIHLDLIELILIYILMISSALFFYRSVRKSRRERVLIKEPGYNLHIAIISIICFTGFQSFKKLKTVDSKVVVMHQASGSVISISNREEVLLLVDYHAMDSIRSMAALDRIKSSSLHRNKIITIDSLSNKVKFNDTEVVVLDESGVILKSAETPILLLSHSPKIHLDKIITALRPQIIIADGSNYRTYVNRWRLTSEKRNIEFLSTYEEGAINLYRLEAHKQN